MTVRSLETTFKDADSDLVRGPEEARGSFPLALALTQTSTAGTSEGRLFAIADADAISDDLVQQIQGNAMLLRDVVFWLKRDDVPEITVDAPDDVKIVHRKDEDLIVFYGATFGVPLLLLGLGWFAQRRHG
ncbi:MAG: hypothetical protein HC923_01940 [Myxococcales bacterium]|nr:hypothetical protein [Myxococcales bacterium]